MLCRCGPCQQVFPHLSYIARKYREKGLKVIGLSLDELSLALNQFVQSQGDKMDYTVGPCAFMIGEYSLTASAPQLQLSSVV